MTACALDEKRNEKGNEKANGKGNGKRPSGDLGKPRQAG